MGPARPDQVSAAIRIINDKIAVFFFDFLHRVPVQGYGGSFKQPVIKLVSSDGILAGRDRKLAAVNMKKKPPESQDAVGIFFFFQAQVF